VNVGLNGETTPEAPSDGEVIVTVGAVEGVTVKLRVTVVVPAELVAATVSV
jgi:hypothetical protein